MSLYAPGGQLSDAAVEAESAILVDRETGTVLYEKDADRQMFPASITKVLTCLVVLQYMQAKNISGDTVVTIGEIPKLEQGATSIALQQGEQLRLMELEPYVLEASTTEEQFRAMFAHITARLRQGRCAALVIRKGALTTACRPTYANLHTVTREQAVALIARMAGARDIFVSTTGKLSRDLFEIRESLGQGHAKDFLTVGSMGHAAMIALGVALAKPERRVWCLDGDGAALMHLGSLGVIAQQAPRNLIHVIMNNGAHETVGGMPVGEGRMRFAPLAREAGYPAVFTADTLPGLQQALAAAQAQPTLCLVEMFCALGARADLGRPTTTPQENRDAFMAYVKGSDQA